MADNLFSFMYWGLGNGFAAGQWPTPGGDLVTGGTPRYQIYRTADGRYLAAAPLEPRFWANFLRVLEAPQLLTDAADPAGTRQAVAALIAQRTAEHWPQRFAGVDACVTVVRTLQEAVASPHFRARGLFANTLLADDGAVMPALPLPIAPALRVGAVGAVGAVGMAPGLGEANDMALRLQVPMAVGEHP